MGYMKLVVLPADAGGAAAARIFRFFPLKPYFVNAPYPSDPCRYGNAIADLIYGDVIPQAKLPLTFPKVENEQKMTKEQWPGIPSKQFPGHLQVSYVLIQPT